MVQQPRPEPLAQASAAEIAADLKKSYGDAALVGAMSALRVAERSGHEPSRVLWAAVVDLLKRDQAMTITLN